MKFEEVTSVEPPVRARVDNDARLDEGTQRRVDYLDGFLKAKAPELSGDEPGGDLYEAVLAALQDIFDPEIPVNIYDLGLIYGVEIDSGHVIVNMTLTTPNCPVAETMPAEVEIRVGAVPGVGIVDVNLVWDPPWDPSKMTDEARLELGML
ncbi:MIP18 family-like domain-containing protein [Sphingomonas antarctica]|uniref:SUF system Fe-S cluster assembly protein n=1 Tax=Sphingomonas antarctica TaxID=2040274 RepID=UPI0039ED9B6A